MKRKILFLFIFVLFVLVFIYINKIIKKYLVRHKYSSKDSLFIKENYEKLMEEPGAKKVSIETSDGLKLVGILILRSGAKNNVLFCHGYRLSKEFMASYIKIFPEDNIFLFDFRAHGESDGKKISLCEEKDAFAAVEFLKKINNLPIIGLGVSMGATALYKVAIKHPEIKVIILDSIMIDLEKNIVYSFMKKNNIPLCFHLIVHFLLKHFYGIDFKNLQKLSTPVLFIHSSADSIIPVSDVIQFFNQIMVKKDLLLIEGCRHGFIYDCVPEIYKEKVISFCKNAEVTK